MVTRALELVSLGVFLRGMAVLCKIFLFASLIFLDTSQDFQLPKSPLKKETLTVPFQWKDLKKHKKGSLLDHRKLVTTQTEHVAHFKLTCSNNKGNYNSYSPTHSLRQLIPFLIKMITPPSPWVHSLATTQATSVFPVPGVP